MSYDNWLGWLVMIHPGVIIHPGDIIWLAPVSLLYHYYIPRVLTSYGIPSFSYGIVIRMIIPIHYHYS